MILIVLLKSAIVGALPCRGKEFGTRWIRFRQLGAATGIARTAQI
jgi:hypothetical protein